MLLDDYIDAIKSLFDKATISLNQHELTIDKRSEQQAHIFGFMVFKNENSLHFREFIDTSEGYIDKVAYSYHFQNKTKQLIFRYDNAKHKPALAFDEHKHCAETIIYAPAPHLQQVINEITAMNFN